MFKNNKLKNNRKGEVVMGPECKRVEKKLSEYLDNMLPKNEKNAIAGHLATCSRCSKLYSDLQAVSNELKSLPAEELPAGFLRKLNKKIAEPQRQAFKKNYIKNYSAVAAGILFLLLIRVGYYYSVNQIKTAYIDDAPIEVQDNGTLAQAVSDGNVADGQKDYSNEKPEAENPQNQIKGNSETKNSQSEESVEITSKKLAESQQLPEANQLYDGKPSPENNEQPHNEQGQKNNDLPPQSYRAALRSVPEQALNSEILEQDLQSGGQPYESAGGTYASSHDTDEPAFVRVVVTVGKFDEVLALLEKSYNTKTVNDEIILMLNNEDFQNVMNLMLKYDATVMQQETDLPLTVNECIIKRHTTQ